MFEVTVILTTYNRANYLSEALNSIFSQTYKDFELIVIDDGSTDNTRDILEPYKDRLTYIWQENSGTPIGPKNIGLKHAKSRWIAYLDSDDIWEPRMLETRINAAQKNPNVGLIYGDCYYFNNSDLKNREKKLAPGRDNNNHNNFPLAHFTNFTLAFDGVLFRRECLMDVGGLDNDTYPNADWYAIMKIAIKWGAFYVPYPGVNVRTHGRHTYTNRVKRCQAVLKSYNKLLSDFPDFNRELGSTRHIAEIKQRWNLSKAYIDIKDTAGTIKCLKCLIQKRHVKTFHKLCYRLFYILFMLGSRIKGFEVIIYNVILPFISSLNRFKNWFYKKKLSKRITYLLPLSRKAFWNQKAEEAYQLRGFKKTEDYHIIQEKLKEIRPDSILDIGCGRGRYFPMYDDVMKIIAIDISDKALNRIPSKYLQDNRFQIKREFLEDLESDDKVDLVISNMVLAHIPPSRIKKAVRKIREISHQVVLDENITDKNFYSFVHDYEKLFKNEGFRLIDKRSLDHGNVLLHFLAEDRNHHQTDSSQ